MHVSAFAVAALALALAVVAHADIKLQSVDRKIDLNSQFARIADFVKVKNTGDKLERAVVLCQTVRPGAKLAFYKVVNDAKAELKVTPTTADGQPTDASCFSVSLGSSLAAGEAAGLSVTAVLATAQTAYPSHVSQNDAQLMVYTDNLYAVSPYQVSTQTTEVSMPGEVKSYTSGEVAKPVSKSDHKVKYGKYDLVKPWTAQELRVHFVNPKQFKHVVSLVREIEVSHWGNIYVEEKYEIKNSGALHTGAFSRLKYAHQYNGKANSFRDLKARYPAPAHSLYYVDIIGNISTSNTRKSLSETVLDFDTRYPLMGGWKTDFTLGYSVPLKGFLFKKRSDGKLRLTMDLCSPLEEVFVQELTVRVVLPEGAHALAHELPYAMDSIGFDTKFTYLDTSGRPVLVLKKASVVPEHAAKFSVDYAFSITSMLREPFLLVSGFFCLLMMVVIYNRMEFTLSKDDTWQDLQAREKLATVMEQIQALLEDGEEVSARLLKVAAGIAAPEDVDFAAKDKAAVERKLKDIDDKVRPLVAVVESASARVGAQVKDVVTKLAGLQARFHAQYALKVELVKKGTPLADRSKRLAAGSAGLKEAQREVARLLESVFGSY